MKAKLIYCDILLSQTELIKKKLMYGRVRDKEIKMIKKKQLGIITHFDISMVFEWKILEISMYMYIVFSTLVWHYMCRSVIIGKEIIYMYFQVHLSLFWVIQVW